MSQSFKEALNERILFLDGAMGTMIQRYGLTEADYRGAQFKDHDIDLKGNNDVLVLTQPHIIAEIHRAYLAAGADIIESCSFNANALSQAEYHLQKAHVLAMNRAAISIAKEQVLHFESIDGRKRFVAASIGPTSCSLSIPSKLDDPTHRGFDFDAMSEAYYEQICAIIESGADLILLETAFDALNTKAAGFAARRAMRDLDCVLPLMISASLADSAGRLLTGQSLEAFVVAIAHLEPTVIGLNCGFGAQEMVPFVERLSACAPCAVACYPNAGLPDESGQYHQDAAHMAEVLQKLARRSLLNLVGACCGSTPDYIAKIKSAIGGVAPRTIPSEEHKTQFSGLNALTIQKDVTLLVGERSNVAGSKKFRRLIAQGKEHEALAVAAAQAQAGAKMIDICMDDAMLDAKSAMTHFLRLIAVEPEISILPLVIDSSHFDLIESALKECQGKCLVNSISLKEGEALFLERAARIRALGGAIVVMAFDEEGQASDTQRRVSILSRAVRLLKEKILCPEEEIVLDPNILAIGTGLEEHRGQALSFMESCRQLRAEFPRLQTIGGLSNLSFAFRGNDTVREAIHAVFLDMAKDCLSMVIANPEQLCDLASIDPLLRQHIQALILNTDPGAVEQIMAWAAKGDAKHPKEEQSYEKNTQKPPLHERIFQSFLKADTRQVQDLMGEALDEFHSALAVIEGPLMQAMAMVGERFAAGELFLPQIVKSASVLREAIAMLPITEGSEQSAQSRKKILLATVKGDVHDIGKNIVKIVLQCNGYEVIDLGVMTPTQDIVETAILQNVDGIGLSGLIAPSLHVMVQVVEALNQSSCAVPLWVGGAATSKTHAAVHLAPSYHGFCMQLGDASSVPVALAQIFGPKAAAYVQNVQEEQALCRQRYYAQARPRTLALDLARSRVNLQPAPKPALNLALGLHDLIYQATILQPYVVWSSLWQTWLLAANSRKREALEEAQSLKADVLRAIALLDAKGMAQINLRFGLFEATSKNEDIHVFADNSEAVLHFIRCQTEDSSFLCLSDYVPSRERGVVVPFVVTTKLHSEQSTEVLVKDLGFEHDFADLLLQSMAQLLVEAASAYFGRTILAPMGKCIRPAVGYPIYPDHSEKELIFDLLRASELGMSLSSHYMMSPVASICALGICHPEAQYFNPRYVSTEQLHNYAQRKGLSPGVAKLNMAVLDFE